MTANHAMALRVVWGTRLDDQTPAPDARELLEMCGLVEPGGREILPEIVGGTLVNLMSGKIPGQVDPDSSPRAQAESGRRPENCTTPPGLRELPPVAMVKRPAPAAKPKAAPAAKAVPQPKPSKAPTPPKERKRATVAVCGTTGGYARHKRLQEPICDPCRAAKNAYWRDRDTARRVEQGRPEAPGRKAVAACGTRSGYMRHLRLGEPTCQPCKDANAQRQRRATSPEETRLPAAGVNPDTAAVLAAGPTTPSVIVPAKPTALPAKRLTPPLPPIDHGTADGWQEHHDRGALPPCDACTAAVETSSTAGPVAVDVKTWLARAQRSSDPAVARAAGRAIGLLVRVQAAGVQVLADGHLTDRLTAALDDVARAEARTTQRNTRAVR